MASHRYKVYEACEDNTFHDIGKLIEYDPASEAIPKSAANIVSIVFNLYGFSSEYISYYTARQKDDVISIDYCYPYTSGSGTTWQLKRYV